MSRTQLPFTAPAIMEIQRSFRPSTAHPYTAEKAFIAAQFLSAAILYRYAQFKGYDTTMGGTAVREFSDYDEISDWAHEAIAWAVNTGLVSGDGNGLLNPKGSATRAQVAIILMRYCENIAK